MKFKDLEGNFHSKDISKYKCLGGVVGSEGELLLRKRLEGFFPNLIIYEQMPCFGTRLRLDFYIKELRLAFEFDGVQHEVFVPHFHGTKRKFQRSKDRDCEKEQWCVINRIKLIRVNSDNLATIKELIRDSK